MAPPFGPNWQKAFFASPYRLRFELSVGDTYVTKFTSAYDRARRLARAALPTSDVVGVIAIYPLPQLGRGGSQRGWRSGNAFELLKDMGIAIEPAIASWCGFWRANDPEIGPWAQWAVRLTWDQADILLWNQIAQDIGVYPQAPVLSKLVDMERGVSVHAYDDRGMDITAVNMEDIAALYDQFDGWLLDFDRPRMTEAFHR